MRIPVMVSDMIYIPAFPELKGLFSALLPNFEHKNPDYYRARSQGRYTGNIDRHIKTYLKVSHPDYGSCIAIPRGGTKLLRKFCDEFEVTISWVDHRHECEPITWMDNDVELWPEQQKLAELMFRKENCIIRSPTGSGKCLAPETEVLMYDGRIVQAQDVIQGDYLIGPDSKPRHVLSTTSGYGMLYTIIPEDGNPWVCNRHHILTLMNTQFNNVTDVPLERYIERRDYYNCTHHKMFRCNPKTGDITTFNFDINRKGLGNYVGWTLDGDGRFLLGDFTVTHNTEVLLKVAEWILKKSGPVLIIVSEGNKKSGLFGQWIERICQRFNIREKEVGMLGSGVKRVKPLTVGMQQTLKNVGRRYIHAFGGVICDEIQYFAAPTFQKVVAIYPARYRFGASADESRRDRKEFLIYDMFGQPAGEIERASLIDKGKILPVGIRMIPTNFELLYEIEATGEHIAWQDLPSDKKNFHELLDEMGNDEERNDLIWQFMEPCLKAGHTLMVATARIAHARYWDKRIRDAGYTCGLMIGGTENAEEFQTTATSLRTRRIDAGVGTIQKIGVGHDIPAWNRGFVLTPLASNKQKFEQMLGRLRRTCDGKKDAELYYMWDNKIYSHHKRQLARIYPGKVKVFVDGQFFKA